MAATVPQLIILAPERLLLAAVVVGAAVENIWHPALCAYGWRVSDCDWAGKRTSIPFIIIDGGNTRENCGKCKELILIGQEEKSLAP